MILHLSIVDGTLVLPLVLFVTASQEHCLSQAGRHSARLFIQDQGGL
jgi:hypothetical protein